MSARPVVFAGDSITEGDRQFDTSQGLGYGYVGAISDRVGDRASIVNAGVGGNTAVDLLARLQRDVLDCRPRLVSVLVGINETIARFNGDDRITTVGAYESTYRQILSDVRAAGVTDLVLMEPFLLPVNDDQREYFVDLDPKREVVARLASEFDAVWVPLQTPLAAEAELNGPNSLAEDGVHPTQRGTELLADAWLTAAGTLL